jgi:hypothetical protein
MRIIPFGGFPFWGGGFRFMGHIRLYMCAIIIDMGVGTSVMVSKAIADKRELTADKQQHTSQYRGIPQEDVQNQSLHTQNKISG